MSPIPPKPRKLAPSKQRRLDKLLDKNKEGTISSVEFESLKKIVAEAEQLMVANAKRLAEFSKKEKTHSRLGAVPVTVWVQPQSQRAEPQ